MKSICGMDCCDKCKMKGKECLGCIETNGHPCGGNCIAAKCIEKGDFDELNRLKNEIMNKVNSMNIENLRINDVNLLNGQYINMEYKISNGSSIKLLKDNNIYFANQVKATNGECYGIAADEDYILICKYGENGSNPEIIAYIKLI